MLGRAQKKFFDRENQTTWPYLNQLFQEGFYKEIDIVIAEHILSEKEDEPVAVLIATLSAALRKGHLCLFIDEETILPKVKELLMTRDGKFPPDFSDLLREGAKNLPSTLCKKGPRIYFQRFQFCEEQVLHHLNRLENGISSSFNEESVEKSLQKMTSLLPEQKQAIKSSSKESVTMLCGGPGTGKTYTAGSLLKVLWESLSEEKKERFQIALAAPTGKAASQLQASLQAALGNKNVTLQAKTLHALLGVHPNSPFDSKVTLGADLVLVDEASMVDVEILSKLFSSLKDGSRLILLGDPYQLPPVEAGSLFNDLVSQKLKRGHGVTMLTECLRAERKSIVEVSEAIRLGDFDSVLSALQKGDGVEWIKGDENTLWKYIQDHIPQSSDIKKAQSFCILTPFRVGPLGVELLNQQIEKLFLDRGIHSFPIILTRNDQAQNLYNGDVGMVTSHHTRYTPSDMAYFQDSNGDVRTIPAILLPKHEYAFCLSVHKSQGSEYDEVLLIMPEGAEIFGREVFYTAATRAKKKLTVWGSKETIQKTLKRTGQRVSGLSN